MADETKEAPAVKGDKPAGKTAGKVGTFVEKHKKAVYVMAGLFVLVVVYFLVRGNSTSTAANTSNPANQNPTGVSPADSGLGIQPGSSNPVDNSGGLSAGALGSPAGSPAGGSSFSDFGGGFTSFAPAASNTSSPVQPSPANTPATASPMAGGMIGQSKISALSAATAPTAKPNWSSFGATLAQASRTAGAAAVSISGTPAGMAAARPVPAQTNRFGYSQPAAPATGRFGYSVPPAPAKGAFGYSVPHQATPPSTSTYAPGGMRRK